MASSHHEEEGGSTADDDTFLFCHYNGEPRSVFPRYINGGCVTHIQIDATLTNIRRTAFQCYRELIEVKLPEGLQVVGHDAFAHCYSLQTANLPSTLRQIKRGAFYGCTKLKKVDFPEGLCLLEKYAFSRCCEITMIKIPSTVNKISDFAFAVCSGLTSVVFCEGLKSIGFSSFEGCTDLTAIEFPSSLREIGQYAFCDCRALFSLKMNEGLTCCDESVFQTCTGLVSVKVPSTVTSIRRGAFYSCERLVSIDIPPSLEYIGPGAFERCSSLISLFLQSSVQLEGQIISDVLSFHVDYGALQRHFANNETDIIAALSTRFDGLHMHKLCYYQAYYSDEQMPEMIELARKCETLERIANRVSTETDAQTQSMVDEFGMTPFHVLALSTSPKMSLWNALFEIYPLILACQTDVWGRTPMDYVLLTNKMSDVGEQVEFVLTKTIMNRVRGNCLGLQKWGQDLVAMLHQWIAGLQKQTTGVSRFEALYSKIALYERMETTSLLELFLWKLKIEEAIAASDDSPLVPSARQDCRFTCGAGVILSNVQQYLGEVGSW